MTTTNRTELEQDVICFAINNFGDGQHAFAEPKSLRFFVSDYVRKCLRKVAESTDVVDEARELAEQIADSMLVERVASTDILGSQENVETHFNQPREEREFNGDDTETETATLTRSRYHKRGSRRKVLANKHAGTGWHASESFKRGFATVSVKMPDSAPDEIYTLEMSGRVLQNLVNIYNSHQTDENKIK